MSLLRSPKLRNLRSTLASIRDRLGGKSRRQSKPLAHRRLTVDPLEQRQLLSVAPADVDDMLVNQTFPAALQTTVPTQSIAIDNDGDFVVVWTRYDQVLDASGNPVIDPITGDPLQDANIYARYFTDEVQRLTLPAGITADADNNGVAGSFSLTYGGNEVQKISITATWEPFTPFQEPIAGTVVFGFDVNGNGIISPSETVTVFFNEGTQSFTQIAASFQTALRGLGGALSDVRVKGVNPHEYLVEFGDLSLGKNQPQITVQSATFTSGFLPAVITTTVREPVTLGPIPVSSNDAYRTANAIQQWFLLSSRDFPIGPIQFPPVEDNRVPSLVEGPYEAPQVLRTPLPGVTVRPVMETDAASGIARPSLTRFDITFDGATGARERGSGKQDHPLLVVASAQHENGSSLPGSVVQTLKEPSPEFRVNPPEPDDPFTPLPDRFNQTLPAVAMDADGEFVITWQSVVPEEPGTVVQSVADVFARRFTPTGIHYNASGVEIPPEFKVDNDNDGVAETPVRCVRPLVTPEAEYVQRLTFDATGSGPLSGSFKLEIGGRQTDEIHFASTTSADLDAVAEDMRRELAELADGRYRDVRVSVVSRTDPYQFLVTLKTTLQQQYDKVVPEIRPTISILPVALPATVSAAYVGVQQVDRDPYTFRVNVETTNAQGQPHVGMDEDGDFVIAYASGAQDLSFFNSIYARRYDRSGAALGLPFMVNAEDTSFHIEPFVALSHDGNFVVTWTTTADADFLVNDVYAAQVLGALYAPDGTTLLSQFVVGGGGFPSTAAFDMNNNFVISWEVFNDTDNVPGASEGVRAIMYRMPAAGETTPTIIRDEFRANSAALDPDSNTLWPDDQRNAQAVLDADGDMVISYEGFGPDVSENVNSLLDPTGKFQQFLRNLFYRPENADLLPFFDPAAETLPIGGFFDPNTGSFISGSNGDVDSVIEEVLIRAVSGATGTVPTDAQLGRLRALLEEVAGLLRGEANGVMFTQLDAAPDMEHTVLFSDSIANAQRDGHNRRFILIIPTTSTGGNFTLRLSRAGVAGGENVQIAPTYTNNLLNVAQTRADIETALRGAARVGVNWPAPNTPYDGPVEVRTVSSGFGSVAAEITVRDGTPWDYDNMGFFFPNAETYLQNYAVYEITFQGESHDWWMFLTVQASTLQPTGTPPPRIFTHTYPDEGTVQRDASLAMEPDGDFLMVWTQDEEFTTGGISNQNIYYRRFSEDTDTAGPRLTDLRISDGRLVLTGRPVAGPIQTITLAFSEDMMISGPDSVTNPANYRLFRNDVEIFGAIAHIEYGLNKAAELAGTINPVTGTVYDVDPVRSNKWEAVITLDGDPSQPGVQPLKQTGSYRIVGVAPQPSQGLSGLRDRSGVPLARTGFFPNGADLARTFAVAQPAPEDISVTRWTAGPDPYTFAETREAVAMDPDGDHVVVWTQPVGGIDKVFVRLFDADGTPADLDLNGNGVIDPLEVDASPAFRVTLDAAFAGDAQRFGTVAMDADGDFVVTWTNYRSGDADIYARRFAANGQAQGPAFRVNGDKFAYLPQKWSDVAVDPHGDFVVTWSSYGQEDGGNLGTGYGVYARRFDSFGVPKGDEFRVNVTIGGNQQFAAVDMDEHGNFVVVWNSDQGGVGDDIIARMFESDGRPKIGPLGGEYPINGYNNGVDPPFTAGNQRYPDVAITASGNDFVVVWTSANQDGSADGVFGRAVNVVLLEQNAPLTMTYDYTGPPLDFGFGNTAIATIDVPFDIPLNNFTISDVNVQIVDLRHGSTSDVKLVLYHPDNTAVTLVENEPSPWQPSSDFLNTVFDDEPVLPPADFITNGYVGPFTGSFMPEGLLAGPGFGLDAFDGKNSSGTWRLVCQDNIELSPPAGTSVDGTLNAFRLILTRTPAMGPIFRINETTIGNQQFASLGMTRQGGFTVAWSGNGDRPGQQDQSGSGVFFREYGFGGTPRTSETRANFTTTGNQRFASVDSDATGNYAIVFTGDRPDLPGETDVYRYLSTDFKSVRDVDGPVVAGVFLGDGTPLVEGDWVPGGASKLIVTFSEDLSVRNGSTGPDSVLNPSNWVLERNGAELPGAIQSITFARNPLSRKYEAELTLSAPLAGGNYTLVALDTINDAYGYRSTDPFFLGNALDGDFDGTSGTNPGLQGHSGFSFEFTVAAEPQRGAELLTNPVSSASLRQTFAEPRGTGYAREESTRSLAVDHDGDYVVVWTSYGQDDPADLNSGGVYFRIMDRNDRQIKGETLVAGGPGNQRNAAVACDADGDFVVVWEAQGDNVDGSWGVYARMYNSVGVPLGAPFRVNTTVANDQLNPSVAMDDLGNFVVVWASKGQRFSYFNDVVGQRYDYRGIPIGFEFVVNSTGVPGTGAGPGYVDLNPAVAMDDDGNFVVAWDQITTQQNGVITDSEIRARLYANTGVPVGPEFPMPSDPGSPGDPDIGRTSRNPQAIMDDQGGFIVVWESWVNAPDASYSVFFEQFDAAANSVAAGQVNQFFFDDQGNEIQFQDQVNASVAIDADGDFAVVWNGVGARPDPLNPQDPNLVTEQDDEGVFIRSFSAGSAYPFVAPEVSVQSRVNMTQAGIQQFPSIGMTKEGDMVVVWSGNGVGDRHGIFRRRYDEPTDTAGPRVSDLLRVIESTGGRERIDPRAQLTQPLYHLVVVFDEEMKSGNPATVPDSVLNPANYKLLKDGIEVVGGIRSIQFGLNPATNKWEALFELDGNGTAPGVVPLGDGRYQIVISNTLRDVVGNPLGSSGLNPIGQSFTTAPFNVVVIGAETDGREVLVNNTVPGDQITRVGVPDGIESSPRAVAGDADGEHVVVWTDTTPGQQGVYAKIYNGLRWSRTTAGVRQSMWDLNGDGNASDADAGIVQIRVTDNPTASFASVARDADGDFVVTWSQNDGTALAPDWNVWARRYDAMGRPFEAAFMVNSVTTGTQRYSAVAMDVDGDFVITWQSDDPLSEFGGRGRDGDGYGVYAQRFSPTGQPLGGTNEVQVLTFVNNPVGTFTLAWDGDNNVNTPNVTAPIQVNGNPFAAVAQIEAQLNVLAGDVNRVEVQAISLTEVIVHFIEKGAARNQEQIVVASTNFASPASRLEASTLIEGYRGEFLVNDTTANNQMFPSVAMDAKGNFVITWTSAGQNGDASYETNIYAKRFLSNDAFRYQANTPERYPWDLLRGVADDGAWAVSTDNPQNHIVYPGSGYEGVVQLYNAFTQPAPSTGTGSLLWTGQHILTAAHVVVDSLGISAAPSIDVYFDLPTGRITMTATQVYIHPGWTGTINNGNDLAIIVLPQAAPYGAERYDIYRGTQELNRVVQMVGYGQEGQGVERATPGDGRKRIEKNVYEIFGDRFNGLSLLDFGLAAGTAPFDFPAGSVLGYDFDSGLSENDSIGALWGIRDLGLGQEEGTSSHGDSGGPSFLYGKIAGVVSGGYEYIPTDGVPAPGGGTGVVPDPTPAPLRSFNVSFGVIGLHTRVSYFADWIDMIAQSTSGEFLVNDVLYQVDPVTNALLPGVLAATGDQKWSSVAMDADGDFVITWTSYGQDGFPNPNLGEEGVFAKRYNASGVPVDATTGSPAWVIDPTTGQPVDPVTGAPVQFDPQTGQPLDPATGQIRRLEFLVNTTTDGKQQHSQVAMDADGDFVIVWESAQSRQTPADFDVFAQRYARNSRIGAPGLFLGPNGEVGGELPLNATKAGNQRFPSVAMDDTGDTVIVWSGSGELPYADRADPQGIYQQRFFSLKDEAGPTVADVANVVRSGSTAALQQVTDNAVIELAPNQFLVSFSENLISASTTTLDSIRNLSNWILTRDGQVLPGGVSSIQFGLNQSAAGTSPVLPGPSNKYEALITLDGDPNLVGAQPLGPGAYVLRIRSFVRDLFGNSLDGDYNGTPGADFTRTFTVSATAGGPAPAAGGQTIGPPTAGAEDQLVHFDATRNQETPAVATDAAGNYVVVWVDYADILDPTGLPTGTFETNIKAKRYDRFGKPIGGEFIVNSYRSGNQNQPDVAMDDFGNFVVTWSGQGEVDAQGTIDLVGIFARVFDAFGRPLGEQFAVNQSGDARRYPQTLPSVAVDANGDFAITWTSYGQDGDLDGVYARRYNLLGQPQGDEFLVNTTVANRQSNSDIAMDADGNFVIVWQAYRHPSDGSEWGVVGRRYNAAGTPLSGEFLINTYKSDDQLDPHVARNSSGAFVVTWSSFLQDTSEWGVYARRYNAAGAALDATPFRVNQTVASWQYQSDVSMADNGNFVVTWTSVNQDNPDAADKGIFARVYNANGTDFTDPVTGTTPREFRVNARVIGNQVDSAVAMDSDGDFAIVWAGPDDDDPDSPDVDDFNGVYHRLIRVNAATSGTGDSGGTTGALGGFYFAGTAGSTSTNPVLTLKGTDGKDVLKVTAGATAASSVVILNGVVQAVPAETTLIVFDGLGGTDTVILTGSAATEKVELWPDRGELKADRFKLTFTSVELVEAYSGGGNDTLLLHDSATAADTAELRPGYARIYSGSTYNHKAYDFRTVYAYATAGGADVVKMYDDPNTADTFDYSPASALLSGTGFSSKAVGFRYVYAYATAGSGDTATLRDNAGTADTFKAYPDQAKLYGDTFLVSASSFRYVYGVATKGSGDVAFLYDDPSGADTLDAKPAQVKFSSDRFSNRADAFDYVYAYSTRGSGDLAILRDNPSGKDVVSLLPAYAKIAGTGYSTRVDSFDKVYAYSTPGSGDSAVLYDDPAGADALKAWPEEVRFQGAAFNNRAYSFDAVFATATPGKGDVAYLYDNPASADKLKAYPRDVKFYGAGFVNRVYSFDKLYAYATAGNGDSAYLYDDPAGVDTLTAYPEKATLFGTGFRNEANAFDYAYAFSTAGSGDTAYLYDQAQSKDQLKVWPEEVRLYGATFQTRAYRFDRTRAYATLGDGDAATLYDDPLAADTFKAWDDHAEFTGPAFDNWAYSFRYVYAIATPGKADAAYLYDSAGKDTLVAAPDSVRLYNGTYSNKVYSFRNVYAYSTKGGYDYATLLDSALEEYPDHLEADANWARLSNDLLGYAYWVSDFEEVSATSSNPSDTKNVNPDALDFILHANNW